ERSVADLVGSEAVNGAVARNAYEPSQRGANGRAVRVHLGPDLDENLLQHFFGFRPAAEDAQDQPEQQTRVAVVQLTKRVRVPGANALQEFEIDPGPVARLHEAV